MEKVQNQSCAFDSPWPCVLMHINDHWIIKTKTDNL